MLLGLEVGLMRGNLGALAFFATSGYFFKVLASLELSRDLLFGITDEARIFFG